MSFTCNIHGWQHLLQSCPACKTHSISSSGCYTVPIPRLGPEGVLVPEADLKAFKAENARLVAENCSLKEESRFWEKSFIEAQARFVDARHLLEKAWDWMNNRHTAPLRSELMKEINTALGEKE